MSRAGRAVPVECGSDARRFFGIRLPLPPGLEHQRPSSSFAPPQPRPGCSLTYQRSKIRLPGPGTSRQALGLRLRASPINCRCRGDEAQTFLLRHRTTAVGEPVAPGASRTSTNLIQFPVPELAIRWPNSLLN